MALEVVADTRRVFYESIKAVESWIEKLDAEKECYSPLSVTI